MSKTLTIGMLVGLWAGVFGCAEDPSSSPVSTLEPDTITSGTDDTSGNGGNRLEFPDGFQWSDVNQVISDIDEDGVGDGELGAEVVGGATDAGDDDVGADGVVGGCSRVADCPSSFVSQCTEPLCVQGRCVESPLVNGKSCDDGIACTIDDACVSGECVGTPVCVCKTTEDCSQYEDGDLCNGSLMCVDQQCVVDATSVVTCPGSEDPCLQNLCNKSTGECVVEPVVTGVSCDDADSCTSLDRCVDGACVGVPIQCDDENPCTANTCTQGNCTNTPIGGLCDDDDPCTTGDTCLSGACIGQPANACFCNQDADCVDFDDKDLCNGVLVCVGNQCKLDPASVVSCPAETCQITACDKPTGQCVSSDSEGGSPCDDGDPCTTNDQCKGGICSGSDVSVCECVVDQDCDAVDDGNLCNGTLKCLDNMCVVDPSTVIACSGVAIACQTYVCEPTTGICSAMAANNGVACDDGDACTLADVCGSGVCVPGAPKPCNDGNPCTSDLCSAGQCVNLPLNGQACDDGDKCTVGDACVSGVCAAGADNGCCEDSQIILSGKSYCTVQEAVDAAKAGDTITLGPLTYTESVTVSKAITIQAFGSPFPNIKSESNTKPVFRFMSGAVGAKLYKLNLFNGNSSVLVDAGAQVEISTCNPKAYVSAGIRVSGGNATLSNVFVSNVGQTTTADGIRVELGGAVSISAGTIEQHLGRGLYVNGGVATISDGTKIQSNKGMGAFVDGGGTLAINGATFGSNSVAGIRVNNGTLTVTSATISGTAATTGTDGVGVWLTSCTVPPQIQGLQVSGSASDGFRLESCTATLGGNLTISNNLNRGVAVLSASVAAINWATISGNTNANMFVQGAAATVANSVLSGAKSTTNGHGANFTDCVGTCSLQSTTVDANAGTGVNVVNSTVGIGGQSVIKNNAMFGINGGSNCTLDIQDSTISDNSAMGVLADGCKTVVSKTTISGTKVTITGTGDAVQMSGCKAGTMIDGSYLKSNQRHGMLVVSCPGVTVNNTELSSNVGYGCAVITTTGFQWTNNEVLSNGGYGMYAQGSISGTISDNTVTNNGTTGIFLAESSALVKNNVISYTTFPTVSGGDGIGLVGAVSGGKPVTPKSTFQGNQVKFNNRHGFYVLSATADIIGNFAENNANSGLYIQPAAVVTVSDNTVTGSGKTGMVCGPGLTFVACANNLFSSNPTDMTPYCPSSCKL